MNEPTIPRSKVERWALLLVIIALALALIFAVFISHEAINSSRQSTSEYVIDSPIEITNRIPGIEGPAAVEGEAWDTVTYRCLDLQTPVVVRWDSTWVSDSGLVLPGSNGAVTAETAGGAGCEGSNLDPIRAPIDTPEGVLAGRWRFHSDLVVSDDEGNELTDTISTSEWVTVIPQEN